jgi:metallo-beta-lactamase family protein
VTGSSYLVAGSDTSFLVDCGMFQGYLESAANNAAAFLFDPKEIDFLILTHAHLDHCGLIAKLYKHGFRGAIHATLATAELTRPILSNACFIQEQEGREKGVDPQFRLQDARGAFELFDTHQYGETFSPSHAVTAKFSDAGHILGSAMTELWLEDSKLVFSGDVGNSPIPIMREPTAITEADVVVCESTYGDRLHEGATQRSQRLLDAALQAFRTGGKLIIPSFAMDRAQDLLYTFNNLRNSGELPDLPVFLDSPLASEITRIYERYTGLFDEEFQLSLQHDPTPFSFTGFAETPERVASQRLNSIKGPAIIIAGSGMADGGRVRFHLLRHLGESDAQVVFVGFQAKGTLGRELVEGARQVQIMDHSVRVRAQVQNIEAFSSHADQAGLVKWLSNFETQPRVFLTHGENTAREALGSLTGQQLQLQVELPEKRQAFQL